jgi:hypothetical protein
MKTLLGALAAIMLLGAVTAVPAQAACWDTPWVFAAPITGAARGTNPTGTVGVTSPEHRTVRIRANMTVS